MKKFSRYFFLSLFIILPLFFAPTTSIPFEVPKVWLFNRYTEILAVLFLLQLPSLKIKKVDQKFIFLLIFFLFINLTASIFGLDFPKSFWGNYYRQDGLFTLLHFISFSLIIANIWQADLFHQTGIFIAIGSFLTSFVSLTIHFVPLFQNNFSGWQKPISATFGNPNFLGGYLTVALPFTFQQIKEAKKTKPFWLVVLILQLITIIFTFSRSAYLVTVIAFIGWILLQPKLTNYRSPLLIILMIIFVSIGYQITSQYLDVKKNYRGFLPENRERIYTKAILAIKKRPILGWGWANFDYAFDQITWPMKYQDDVYVDKPHSTILEVTVASGFLGLAAFLSIVGHTFKKIKKIRLKSAGFYFLALILYLIHSQTNIVSISEELIFWLTVGISGKDFFHEKTHP